MAKSLHATATSRKKALLTCVENTPLRCVLGLNSTLNVRRFCALRDGIVNNDQEITLSDRMGG
jgi:hypothetical protein